MTVPPVKPLRFAAIDGRYICGVGRLGGADYRATSPSTPRDLCRLVDLGGQSH